MKYQMSEDKQFEFTNSPISPCGFDQEKKIRRQIANSNERRRMQSINSGFQTLSTLLPSRKGVKLSKAAILQSTTDYLVQLKEENLRLMERVHHLTRMIPSNIQENDGNCSGSPLPKRKRVESVDCINEENSCSTLSQSERAFYDREIIELRLQLEHERNLVSMKEQQLRNCKSRLYSSDSAHDDDAPDQICDYYHSSVEKLDEYSIRDENGLSNPQTIASSQNVESLYEKSPRRSSLELSQDAPNDFSVRNVLLRNDERSLSDATFPGVIMSSNDAESIPVDSDNSSRRVDCTKSTSRQNLERIIEAIKHVDGEHMFCDEPQPKQSKLTCSVNRSAIIVALRQEETQPKSRQIICPNLSFTEKIPRSASLNPSNPGVIVSNHF